MYSAFFPCKVIKFRANSQLPCIHGEKRRQGRVYSRPCLCLIDFCLLWKRLEAYSKMYSARGANCILGKIVISSPVSTSCKAMPGCMISE